jgi:hypothetical protein
MTQYLAAAILVVFLLISDSAHAGNSTVGALVINPASTQTLYASFGAIGGWPNPDSRSVESLDQPLSSKGTLQHQLAGSVINSIVEKY